jgi:hypothetical protein
LKGPRWKNRRYQAVILPPGGFGPGAFIDIINGWIGARARNRQVQPVRRRTGAKSEQGQNDTRGKPAGGDQPSFRENS